SFWDSIRLRWPPTRSSSASTCRVPTRRYDGAFPRSCAKVGRLRIPSHSPWRAAAAVRLASLWRPLQIAPAAFRKLPHGSQAERIQAGNGSEDAMRAAIAHDVAEHLPQDDAYLLRLHTSTVLRAVRELHAR